MNHIARREIVVELSRFRDPLWVFILVMLTWNLLVHWAKEEWFFDGHGNKHDIGKMQLEDRGIDVDDLCYC